MRMRKKSWAEPFLAEHEEVVVASPASMKGHWRARLNKDNLHLEIGCGKGDYFTHMAAMYPESGWIGVEKNINVAAIAAKKLVDSNNINQLLIAMDAEKIDEWFDHGEVDVIHLNFSDPWPKAGYKKRRLSHRRFIEVDLCKSRTIIECIITNAGYAFGNRDACNLITIIEEVWGNNCYRARNHNVPGNFASV